MCGKSPGDPVCAEPEGTPIDMNPSAQPINTNPNNYPANSTTYPINLMTQPQTDPVPTVFTEKLIQNNHSSSVIPKSDNLPPPPAYEQ